MDKLTEAEQKQRRRRGDPRNVRWVQPRVLPPFVGYVYRGAGPFDAKPRQRPKAVPVTAELILMRDWLRWSSRYPVSADADDGWACPECGCRNDPWEWCCYRCGTWRDDDAGAEPGDLYGPPA
jgi:hypothetical protein